MARRAVVVEPLTEARTPTVSSWSLLISAVNIHQVCTIHMMCMQWGTRAQAERRHTGGVTLITDPPLGVQGYGQHTARDSHAWLAPGSSHARACRGIHTSAALRSNGHALYYKYHTEHVPAYVQWAAACGACTGRHARPAAGHRFQCSCIGSDTRLTPSCRHIEHFLRR